MQMPTPVTVAGELWWIPTPLGLGLRPSPQEKTHDSFREPDQRPTVEEVMGNMASRCGERTAVVLLNGHVGKLLSKCLYLYT